MGDESQAHTAAGSLGLVDVGGRQLYLACQGEGSPTVVLEAGGTGKSADWIPVHQEIAEFTRVCAYDWAGEGQSSSVPAHHNLEAMVHDLHALLDVAGIEGPYVMVGHSFGGFLVRLFTSLYPEEVVGLVLVDPGHEEFSARAQAVVTQEEWHLYQQFVANRGGIGMEERLAKALPLFQSVGDRPLIVLSARIPRPSLPGDINTSFIRCCWICKERSWPVCRQRVFT